MDQLKDLASLGPALGSVVVLGLVAWRLLQLFDKRLERSDLTMQGLSRNVEKNTEATERMILIIDQQYNYVPRKSPAHK